MLFVILHQIPDDQIGIDEPLCFHRLVSRAAAFRAADWRIFENSMPLPFLLASAPFNDCIPGCTRRVAWSPSTAYSRRSPGRILRALRTCLGMVVWPLLVTVDCISFLTDRHIPYV